MDQDPIRRTILTLWVSSVVVLTLSCIFLDFINRAR